MRFITLLAASGDFGAPPPQIFAAIGQLAGEAGKALVDNAGLAGPDGSVTATLAGGKITDVKGVTTSSAEAFAIYDVADLDEAVGWARKFLECYKNNWPGWEGTVEIRQLFGPADM